jgi:amidase
MISRQDYTSYDGLGLAELMACKEVTPEELVAAALEAIAKVNPKLNAVLQTFPKEAAHEITRGLPAGGRAVCQPLRRRSHALPPGLAARACLPLDRQTPPRPRAVQA